MANNLPEENDLEEIVLPYRPPLQELRSAKGFKQLVSIHFAEADLLNTD